MTISENDLSRLIDAAANRAREGIRVVEDYCRFALNDAPLAEKLKHLRHEITRAAEAVLPYTDGLSARQSEEDVGRTLSRGEARTDLDSLLKANLKRAQEALRSLEEFSKLSRTQSSLKTEAESPSGLFKHLRYELYTVEKEFFLMTSSESEE